VGAEALSAQELYEACVRYLLAHGWRREEYGSGWWWKDDHSSEADLEEAVGLQLRAEGVDLRTMLPDEPQEFWG
jgi:hypothetical protein